jgi:hypothetical protein
MSYPRMCVKLLWRTGEVVRIRACGGILMRDSVNLNIPVLWDMMLCRDQTRCDKVCSFYCLNMFRAPICPSSGVQLVNVFRL